MRKPKSGSADPKPSDETLPSAGSSASKSSGDYEVGYGKPPKNTRFVKGRSGNPKGAQKRAADATDVAAELRKVAEERIEVVIDGKVKRITATEACFVALRNKALKADVQAQKLWIAVMEKYAPDLLVRDVHAEPCGEEDKAIAHNFLERKFAGFRNSTARFAEIPEGAKTRESTAGPVEPQDSKAGESPTGRSEDCGTQSAGCSGSGVEDPALAPAVNGPPGQSRVPEPALPPAARRGRTMSSTYLRPVAPSSGFDLSPRQAIAGFPVIRV